MQASDLQTEIGKWLTRVLQASSRSCLRMCVIPRNMPAVACWLALLREGAGAGAGAGASIRCKHGAVGSIPSLAFYLGLGSRCVVTAQGCGVLAGTHTRICSQDPAGITMAAQDTKMTQRHCAGN